VTSRLVDACRLRVVDRTPVWLMRQAGRYLPEYRALREKWTLLQICAQPVLAAEVTLQPLRRFPLDAAIIFADILLPLVPMGATLRFATNEGPVIENGVSHAEDVERLRTVDVRDSLAPTLDALRIVRRELHEDIALIGFAGAPFTLASYLIEGGTSRRFLRTKRFMLTEPVAFARLMERLSRMTADWLVAQVQAGADVVQLFDSWVGWLGPDDYRAYVLPHMPVIFDAVRAAGAPSIHFGVDNGGLLECMREAGGDVIGLDWRTTLRSGWRRIGHDRGVQGNLDPAVLFAPHAEIERRARAILADADRRAGHIFNLGHGVLPDTPVESIRVLVDAVRAHG
jgi:uroporphyrinogen decarboxylase